MANYDDDNPWRGDNSWAIPADPRKRRDIDIGSNRQAFKVLRQDFKVQSAAARADCWAAPALLRGRLATDPARPRTPCVHLNVGPSGARSRWCRLG